MMRSIITLVMTCRKAYLLVLNNMHVYSINFCNLCSQRNLASVCAMFVKATYTVSDRIERTILLFTQNELSYKFDQFAFSKYIRMLINTTDEFERHKQIFWNSFLFNSSSVCSVLGCCSVRGDGGECVCGFPFIEEFMCAWLV